MKLAIAALALCAVSLPALAQKAVMSWTNGRFNADWPSVVKCALKPVPGSPDNTRLARVHELKFQDIKLCRAILTARHAGWIESGKKAEDDPYQPVLMFQPDDFKTPLTCEHDGDAIRCNDDD